MKLITIGDSWTWGDSLEENGHDRLTSVYGYHLSKLLNADWENIAECGASNAYIAQQYNEVVNKNHDDEILIVCTLTEVGRDFNINEFDEDRDYIQDLRNVKTFSEVQNKQSEWVENKFNLNNPYKTIFGVNFIDSNYTKLDVLEKSWLRIITEHTGQTYIPNVYTVLSWTFDLLETAYDFTNCDRTVWLHDQLNAIEKANKVVDILMESPLNYKKASKHPTPLAHKLWANYIYEQWQRSK